MKKTITILAVIFLVSLGFGQNMPWLYQPTNEVHPIGNNYMEFQDYSGGSSSYYHDGIDIMAGYGNRPVFSSNTGVMTHLSTGTMYGGLMIGQAVAGGQGWLYWHIPSSSMQFSVGDSIYTGEFIGRAATWSVYSFHHVHFNKVVGTGGYPWSWYSSTDNPLLYLQPYDDPDAPFFHNAYQNNIFAFAQNGTSNYLNPVNLSGQVDIIANIADVINDPAWLESPFQVRYWINGPVSISPTMSFYAAGWCPADNTINVPYREDATCLTQGNYTVRNYFFNVTNTDGDSTVELSDANYSWNTTICPGGNYMVFVEAKDRFGNTTMDSMQVTVAGGANFSLTFEPVNPPIIIPSTGGAFEYSISVSNTGTGGGVIDVWIMVTLPSGSTAGPLLLAENLNIPAGGTVSRIRAQSIPPLAPAGEYYYWCSIGDYPGMVLQTDGFNFTKQP